MAAVALLLATPRLALADLEYDGGTDGDDVILFGIDAATGDLFVMRMTLDGLIASDCQYDEYSLAEVCPATGIQRLKFRGGDGDDFIGAVHAPPPDTQAWTRERARTPPSR